MRALAVVAASAALASCASSPRDVATEGREVRVAPGGDAGVTAPSDAYVYVARRAHGVVALAEARHMPDETARAIVDKLASDLDACAARLEREGTLVEGAARIVAVAQPSGPPGLNVRLAPGGDVAQNALMCLVAPVRAVAFPPPNAAGPPGMAIEATWGPATTPQAP